ncbi:MAG: GGDEF domain-containing protein [Desulfitobacterium hafniense]|nr:GGDEF domain-containing protein [Desulfitobacterium hafniense]
MKKFLFQFAPFILLFLGAVLWVTAYHLDILTSIPKGLVWFPFVLIQLLVNVLCGILIQRLYQGTNKDPLTGLKNRKFFYEKLNEEMERVNRTGASLSLVFIDIDNFKQTNDTYGHSTGDEVLKKLAIVFESSTRSIDTVARWGGEEFAIILPETNSEGATIFAERLRKNVQDLDFGINSTISIGVATTETLMDPEDFLAIADKCLYKAKETRNKVVTALRIPSIEIVPGLKENLKNPKAKFSANEGLKIDDHVLTILNQILEEQRELSKRIKKLEKFTGD